MRDIGRFRFAPPDLVALRDPDAEERRVVVDGAEIAYVRWRPRSPRRGEAVLIPGFTANHEDFNGFGPLLAAAGWEVIALSQRGQGPSTGPANVHGYSMHVLAHDVVAVIEDAGWKHAHVLGHSFGGLVATELGIAYPDHVRSLTLWNSGPFRSDDGFPIHLDDVIERGAQALIDERIPGADTDPVQGWYADRIRNTEQGELEFALRSMLGQRDRTAQLEKRRLPVLVGHGEHDAAWPQRIQRTMAARLHADYVVVADAGHCSHWDRPEWCARLLDGFWRDQE